MDGSADEQEWVVGVEPIQETDLGDGIDHNTRIVTDKLQGKISVGFNIDKSPQELNVIVRYRIPP